MVKIKKVVVKKEEKKVEKMREFLGTVVSTGMNKTIVARVDGFKINEKYQKKYRVSKKFHIHDEKEVAKVGDMVRFVGCRPMSKTKRWRLVAVVKK